MNNSNTKSSLKKIEIINQFAQDMLASVSLEDLLWAITEDVGRYLDFEDFILYLREGDKFLQRAAFGNKNPKDRSINDPIIISLGEGIVGSVGQTGKTECISDLDKDPRYLADTVPAKSELTVPLIYQNEVIAIFDAESTQKNAFSESDIQLFETLANMSAPRIWSAMVETDRDKMAMELLRTEIQYRMLIEQMPEPIVIHRDGEFLSCNNAALDLFGYSLEEISSLPISQHIHTNDWTLSLARLTEIQKGSSISRVLINYFKRNGEQFVGETYGYLSEFEGSNAIISVIHDVTAQKLIEDSAKEINIELEKRVSRRTKQLQHSEEQIRLLLDSTAEAIYGLNLNGECTFCNPSCVKVLGYDFEEELIGKKMHQLFHYQKEDGSPYPETDCNIYKSFRDGTNCHIDNEVFWRKDKTSFPVEYWSHPVRRDGVVIGSVVTFFDSSKKIELEAQRLQLQKMQSLGNLAGGVAHDLNNMLTPILGFSELLAENLDSSVENKNYSYANTITTSARRAQALVAQILLFTQRKKTNQEVTDLAPMIPELVSFIRPTFPASINISSQVSTNQTFTKCNADQIYQCLLNFCVNAMEAISDKGNIFIGLDFVRLVEFECWNHIKLSGDFIKLSVTDDGIGMGKSIRGKIFEPFFTTKEMASGVGLGLSTVFGIVDNHDGGIHLSTEPDKGSCFDIYLPSANATKTKTPSPISHKAENRDKKILVVEDEDSIALLCKIGLEQAGYNVTLAISGDEGLRIFEQDSKYFDLIITDYSMPGINGAEFADAVNAINSNMPIILTSGFNTIQFDQGARPNSISHFLDKPYSPAELKKLVQEILA